MLGHGAPELVVSGSGCGEGPESKKAGPGAFRGGSRQDKRAVDNTAQGGQGSWDHITLTRSDLLLSRAHQLHMSFSSLSLSGVSVAVS